MVFIVHHVSDPYERTDLTFVLRILILLWMGSAVEFNICFRLWKARLALLIQLLMSRSVPLSLLTMLPRYTNFSDPDISWLPSLTETFHLWYILMSTVILCFLLVLFFLLILTMWSAFVGHPGVYETGDTRHR